MWPRYFQSGFKPGKVVSVVAQLLCWVAYSLVFVCEATVGFSVPRMCVCVCVCVGLYLHVDLSSVMLMYCAVSPAAACAPDRTALCKESARSQEDNAGMFLVN